MNPLITVFIAHNDREPIGLSIDNRIYLTLSLEHAEKLSVELANAVITISGTDIHEITKKEGGH